MHIIVTLKKGAFIADYCRMRISKTMMNSIGKERVGQIHSAAKSNRNFVHNGTVMTVGIHFEYKI